MPASSQMFKIPRESMRRVPEHLLGSLHRILQVLHVCNMKILLQMHAVPGAHTRSRDGSELTRAFTAWVYNVRRISVPLLQIFWRGGLMYYLYRECVLYCYRLDVEPPLTFLCLIALALLCLAFGCS